MNIPGLVVAKTASGEIKPRVIVCHGSDGAAKQAADGKSLLIGVSTIVGAAEGETVDVIRSGLALVIYGDSVAIGDALTANESGHAVPAASGDFILGYAEDAGSANEIGSVWIAPTKQSELANQ